MEENSIIFKICDLYRYNEKTIVHLYPNCKLDKENVYKKCKYEKDHLIKLRKTFFFFYIILFY